jgi:aspartate aminotransferase
MGANDLAEYLAKHRVIIRSGETYGPAGKGHIRISFSPGEAEIREGLRKISEAVGVLERPET